MGTNLHVPLETGAWQVRIYELGEAKSTATSVGDLMKALKFDDAKNTTFTLKVSFPLPKRMLWITSASRHATPRVRLSKARASPQLAHAPPSTAPSTTPKPRSSAPMASPTCVTVLPPSSM